MRRKIVMSTTAVIIGAVAIVGASFVGDIKEGQPTVEKEQGEVVSGLEDDKKSDKEVINELENMHAKPVFKVHESIPPDIVELMKNKSLPENAKGISVNDLAYLELAYKDYNGHTQIGEMIVNKKVAKEVTDIFKEIYDSGFPIEKMELVDMYEASDDKSMLANNSSAFNYRTIAGTNVLSNHGKGVAIDINPFSNPHVVKGVANPKDAQKFADRTLDEKDMIKEGDPVYKAFTSKGWKWGGHWDNPDYQHFEKEI
ncbi:M15 family metallopeptidase [Paraclostridium bifermentans]